MTPKMWPPGPGNARGGPNISLREQGIVVVTICLNFAAIVCFGADRNDLALLFSALLSFFLLGILLTEQWARTAVTQRKAQLYVPGALFALSCLACLWAATPFSPNGPHPIWEYVTAWPATAIDRSAIFIGELKLIGLASGFLLSWIICSSDERARYLFRVFVIAMVVYGVWALLANVYPDLKFGVYGAFQGQRLSGSFQSANTAGTLFGVGCLTAICLTFGESRKAGTARGALIAEITFPVIAAALLATCLVLTASRGAATATLGASTVVIIWELFARDWRSLQRRKLSYGAVATGLLLILAWSGSVLAERYANSFKDWMDQRQAVYSVHWDAITASPWFGYGLGTFDQINKLLETSGNYSALWNIRAAHNVYLQWLEQGGIVAALPMFLCLAWIIARTGFGVWHRHRMTTWLRGLVAVSILIIVHGWSDFSLEVPAVAMLWTFLLGAGYAISNSSRTLPTPVQASPSESDRDVQFQHWPSVAAMTFACVAGLLCAASWWEIAAPFGVQPLFLPVSNAFAYKAQQLMASQNSWQAGDARITAAYQLTQRELLLSPAQADGWLRMASIASIQKRPIVEISNMLERSYLVAPLDPQLFNERSQFVLENWNRITPAVRQDALAQFRVGWGNWLQKQEMLRLANQVRNPSGHLALKLIISELASPSGLVGRSN